MRIYVKAIPGSSRNSVAKISDEEYRVKITAPPIGGKANKMLIKILADYFNKPKSSFTIIGGKTARIKIIDIT